MKFTDMLLTLVARYPLSGYQMKKWLDREGIFVRANANMSQIYRTLHSLEGAGLITHDVVVSEEGPDAKVYRITPAGIEHLYEVARSPYQPPVRWQEPDFLARIVLIAPLLPETLIPTIDQEIAYRRAQRRSLHEQLRPLPVVVGSPYQYPELISEIREMMIGRGDETLDIWVRWLTHLRRDIGEALARRGFSVPKAPAVPRR